MTKKNKNVAKPSANWADDGCSSEEEAAKKEEENAEAPQGEARTPETYASISKNRHPVRTHKAEKSTEHIQRIQIDPLSSDDESWTLVGDRKPGPKRLVLYIGYLNAECTTEKLASFVQEMAKKIGSPFPRSLMRNCTTPNLNLVPNF